MGTCSASARLAHRSTPHHGFFPRIRGLRGVSGRLLSPHSGRMQSVLWESTVVQPRQAKPKAGRHLPSSGLKSLPQPPGELASPCGSGFSHDGLCLECPSLLKRLPQWLASSPGGCGRDFSPDALGHRKAPTTSRVAVARQSTPAGGFSSVVIEGVLQSRLARCPAHVGDGAPGCQHANGSLRRCGAQRHQMPDREQCREGAACALCAILEAAVRHHPHRGRTRALRAPAAAGATQSPIVRPGTTSALRPHFYGPLVPAHRRSRDRTASPRREKGRTQRRSAL